MELDLWLWNNYLFFIAYIIFARGYCLINSNRSPKHIADEMGHNLQTHLKSYSRLNTKDLVNVFDSVVEKSENTV